jgi:serine/threonine protein kinase
MSPDAFDPGSETTLSPAPLPESPAVTIGSFRLLQRIGAGGMGEVWLARQSDPVRRQVALKLIKPGFDSDRVLARFEAERQALARMSHPAIAAVLDGGTTPEGRDVLSRGRRDGQTDRR